MAATSIPSIPFILGDENQYQRVAEWWQRVESCQTLAEYFTTMRAFRATTPGEQGIVQLYDVARVKLCQLKNPAISLDTTKRSPEPLQSAGRAITPAEANYRHQEGESPARSDSQNKV